MFSGVSSAIISPLFNIIILEHIELTSGNICVLINIVCFFPNDLINFLISAICFGSNPTVGSSSTKTFGFPIKAPAKLTLCLYPLERFAINLFSTDDSPVWFITLSTSIDLSFLATFFNSAKYVINSFTVKSGYNAECSDMYPICCFAFFACFWMSYPFMYICPSVGSMYPVIMFIVVVLPAPFGPKNPTISFSLTSKFIDFIISFLLYLFVTLHTFIKRTSSTLMCICKLSSKIYHISAFLFNKLHVFLHKIHMRDVFCIFFV